MSILRHGCLALLASLALGQAVELTVLEAGSAAQLTALGNEALMQGRYETAIEHYRRALSVDKTSFQALFNLALAQFRRDGGPRGVVLGVDLGRGVRGRASAKGTTRKTTR